MRNFIIFLTAIGISQSPLRAQLPTITNQPASRAVWEGGNVTFTVAVSGTGPFTYQWQLNNTNLPNGIITTVAGGGIGDGSSATNVSLNTPSGVAVDASGNLFIADSNNERIRKVDTNGIITTVAGGGIGGSSLATNASLNTPWGVAVDASGNLFIADTGNNRVCKVSTNGIITILASTVAVYGVAPDRTGNLFFGSYLGEFIAEVSTNGTFTVVAGKGVMTGLGYTNSGDGGPATSATFYFPSDVAVDSSGELFIADANNLRIRKVSTNGIITTVAGNGMNAYSGDGCQATNASLAPWGVAVDTFGNLFIADRGNSRIRKVDSNGIITTVAGNGIAAYSGDGTAATNASLNRPTSVAVDAAGNLFIADAQNNRIRKVGTNGIITTVAGGGVGDRLAATDATLNGPLGVAVDASGNLFIAGGNRIRKVSASGIITTVAGNGSSIYSGDGGAGVNAGLAGPFSVAVDLFGNLFIADGNSARIREVDTNGIIRTVAGNGTASYSGDGGAATNATLNEPTGIAVDVFDNLFIADQGNNRIREVGTNGIITTVAGMGPSYPGGGFSGDGGPATNASLWLPVDVTVDASGNLFIADRLNFRIRKVDANGLITTVAGGGAYNSSGAGGPATNASLNAPTGVGLDAIGNLFIADGDNDGNFWKVDTNGIITIEAGNGSLGYSGDGGFATNASLYYPWAVAVDTSGDQFIADSFNNRIRKVINTQRPALTLNNVTVTNAGNYELVVTGPGGSVTSSVANLTVTTVPIIHQTFLNTDGSVTLSFVSQPNSTNVVFCTTNLSPPVIWQPVSTNKAGPDGDWQYTDTNAVSFQTQFYRSLTQ